IGKGWSQPEIPDYFRPSLNIVEQRKALIAVGRRKYFFKNNTIEAQCPAWGAGGRVFESLRPDQY
ncbi:hypothetical protein, partial [Stutzerimonas kunmingensis]|uniref:hypothetical protein n=1 Tax=Stutzerimonas kunmingensis TaxID=1211807 RepID=UPI0028AF001F